MHTTAVPAKTVGRAVHLLKIIASSRTRNLRLVDIAYMASLDKSTAQRLLRRLVFERLLAYDSRRGYRLGPLLYELGLGTFPETNLREITRTTLQELAHFTGNTVFLVARSGFETVCINRVSGHFPVQTMTRTEGDRHPLGIGAGGLAILAALNDTDVDLVINAIAPRLHTYQHTGEMLIEAVQATRSRGGIAIDEGSAALGITAIGRAIHDQNHHPVAAVFVASTSSRMVKDHKKQVIKQLGACIDTVENMLSAPQVIREGGAS